MTLTKEQKQKIFNLFVETYDIHLMDDELNQIGNIVYPLDVWKARPIDIQSGWKNNAKILAEVVTEINNEIFIEDESAEMEKVDIVLEWVKKKLGVKQGDSSGDVLLAEISGYVAMNDSKSIDISNMSFDGSLSRINRHWGASQQIKRCKILISK